jgi:hypothetical protein
MTWSDRPDQNFGPVTIELTVLPIVEIELCDFSISVSDVTSMDIYSSLSHVDELAPLLVAIDRQCDVLGHS